MLFFLNISSINSNYFFSGAFNIWIETSRGKSMKVKFNSNKTVINNFERTQHNRVSYKQKMLTSEVNFTGQMGISSFLNKFACLFKKTKPDKGLSSISVIKETSLKPVSCEKIKNLMMKNGLAGSKLSINSINDNLFEKIGKSKLEVHIRKTFKIIKKELAEKKLLEEQMNHLKKPFNQREVEHSRKMQEIKQLAKDYDTKNSHSIKTAEAIELLEEEVKDYLPYLKSHEFQTQNNAEQSMKLLYIHKDKNKSFYEGVQIPESQVKIYGQFKTLLKEKLIKNESHAAEIKKLEKELALKRLIINDLKIHFDEEVIKSVRKEETQETIARLKNPNKINLEEKPKHKVVELESEFA